MAQKRMFDKTIVDSDDFLEMPMSSQVLYFHLNMRADDDGFVNNWKSIMKLIGAKEDDLKILIAKQFIIPFQSGVLVIKHWKIHNYIRKDTYNETKYQDEKSLLITNESKEYEFKDEKQSLVDDPLTQYSIDKNRIDKISIDKNIYSRDVNVVEKKEIIDYLNLKLGTKYKYTTIITNQKIEARFKEGFTVEDFKKVIDKKTRDWLGTKYEKYLRPETLFGTKFEGYLNEKERELTTNDIAKNMNWEEFFNE